MKEFERYAIYYAPPAGPLADFTASWLGWDAAQGTAVPHPDIAGLPAEVATLTATPRKYGFHGTIKPPFRPTQTRRDLMDDLAEFARTQAPVTLDRLQLTRLGGFLALTPRGETAALSALAGDVVAALDHHRMAPTGAELARRRAAGLTPAQEANLLRWGYPYVMGEFRFHLTLTGNLSAADAAQIEDALAPHLTPLLPAPFEIAKLCLFGEELDGRFHLLHRYTLSG